MRNVTLPALALCAALGLASAAAAQVPSGGPGSDAKGNAPLKAAHTVDDGGARRGHNSFTEGQARKHILKAGFQSVTGLTKGQDGVWRGVAVRNGASVQVGMDYKGNVTEGVAPAAASAVTSSTTTTTREAHGADATTASATHAARRRHHTRCANPGPNGAACSGVDRNGNGVSDREDRAIGAGAHP